VHVYEHAIIELQSYRAKHVGGKFELRDHDAVAWVLPTELRTYKLAPADLPTVEAILQDRKGS